MRKLCFFPFTLSVTGTMPSAAAGRVIAGSLGERSAIASSAEPIVSP
jgi:hypothetical protein